MKKLFHYLPLLGILLLTSCDGTFFGHDDNTSINPADLAVDITNYIQDNYAGYSIQSIEFEDICDDVQFIEVELEDGPGPDVDLYFTLDNEFAFAATDIAEGALPQAVLDVIAQDFSDYTIDPDHIEQFELADGSLQYEVELELSTGSDLEVIFNADGSIFCQHNSSDDDDSNDDNSGDDDNSNDGNGNDDNGNDDNSTGSAQLTDAMRDFIKNNYPGYKIEDVEFEDICDDVQFIEVELEDGPGPDIDLYFTLDKEFAFAATEISVDELPQTVLDAIAQQFSGYDIDDDKVQKFELADGSLQFEVELEPDNGSDVEVVFHADGSIFCQD